MRYMKEIVRKNKIWVLVYLAIGLLNAFMANYKADYFQRIVDGLTERTITISGILLYGAVLVINYGMNYLDEYPTAKLSNEIYLDFKLLALQKLAEWIMRNTQKLELLVCSSSRLSIKSFSPAIARIVSTVFSDASFARSIPSI